MQEDGSFFCCFKGMVWKGVSAEERTPVRSKLETIKTPNRGGSGHGESGQACGRPWRENQKGLLMGLTFEGCFSFRRAEIVFTKRGSIY